MPEQRSTEHRAAVADRDVTPLPAAALARWAAAVDSTRAVGFVPTQPEAA